MYRPVSCLLNKLIDYWLFVLIGINFFSNSFFLFGFCRKWQPPWIARIRSSSIARPSPLLPKLIQFKMLVIQLFNRFICDLMNAPSMPYECIRSHTIDFESRHSVPRNPRYLFGSDLIARTDNRRAIDHRFSSSGLVNNRIDSLSEVSKNKK